MFKFRRGSLFNEHTNGLEVLKLSRKLPELLDHTIETVTTWEIGIVWNPDIVRRMGGIGLEPMTLRV